MHALSLRPHAWLTIALVSILTLLASSSPAHAAEAYAVEPSPCNQSWGGGQYDSNGTFYIACVNVLHVISYNGAHTTYPVPPGLAAYDVAPSPDGQYLYISNLSTVFRLVWNGAGYAHDPAWRLGTFPYGGERTAQVYWLATDAWGSIYVTDIVHHTIVKYAANGTYMTRFGEYTSGNAPDVSSWKPGEFYWRAGGIGVSRDGRHVYVGEVGNNRVQRFDWQENGHYAFNRMWGNTREFDPQRQGSCADGRFAAPYDVGVDPWGFVYVSNTTCGQFQKFTSDGAHVYSSAAHLSGAARNHGIAVDAHGNAYSGELGKRIARTTPEPGPWPVLEPLVPDTTAPTLTQVAVPAETTAQTITVSITATDNRKVVEYRTANEDGTWGVWKAFAPDAQQTAAIVHTLSAGYAIKGVYVQVRDAADNQSTYVYRTLRYRAAAADATAPVLNGVTVPATTAQQQVTIGLQATDNVAVSGFRIANEDGNWGAWGVHAAEIQHTLTAGYGVKGVYVQVRDAAGNDSNVIYRTLRYALDGGGVPADGGGGAAGGAVDGADPVVVNATIPPATDTRIITVAVEATDDVGVTQMRFANEDGTWLAWRAFAPNAQHELSAGFGGKAVYVQVRDAAGRESNTKLMRTRYQQVVAAGAAADVVAPTLDSLVIPATTDVRTIAVTMTTSDNVGAIQVRFANEDGNWGAWVALTANPQHALTANYGPKAVYAQVRDAAGNESNTRMARTRYQVG